jgi:hypothetical protein
VLDQIVDDPPLQFERNDFYQRDADGQRHQEQLMYRARRRHIAEDAARQRARRGGIEFVDPGPDAHRVQLSGHRSAPANDPERSFRTASTLRIVSVAVGIPCSSMSSLYPLVALNAAYLLTVTKPLPSRRGLLLKTDFVGNAGEDQRITVWAGFAASSQ